MLRVAARIWPTNLTTCAGAAAALALTSAGIVQQRFLNADQVTRWIRTRSASESLKSEVSRYLARSSPYDNANRIQLFSSNIQTVQESAKDALLDLERIIADGNPIPRIEDFASYLKNRAEHQRSWHRQRISDHQRAARTLRGAEISATLMAAILAAVGASLNTSVLSGWIAVGTTIGAALAAHLAASQHDRIAASYAVTADRLGLLIETLQPHPEIANKNEFVANVEACLAAQNDSWLSIVGSR